jgi:hypothetical protein
MVMVFWGDNAFAMRLIPFLAGQGNYEATVVVIAVQTAEL